MPPVLPGNRSPLPPRAPTGPWPLPSTRPGPGLWPKPTLLASFRELCLEFADLETGPAAEALKKGMARAQQNDMNGRAAVRAQDAMAGPDLRSNFGNHRIGAGTPFSYGYGQPVAAPSGGWPTGNGNGGNKS